MKIDYEELFRLIDNEIEYAKRVNFFMTMGLLRIKEILEDVKIEKEKKELE